MICLHTISFWSKRQNALSIKIEGHPLNELTLEQRQMIESELKEFGKRLVETLTN